MFRAAAAARAAPDGSSLQLPGLQLHRREEQGGDGARRRVASDRRRALLHDGELLLRLRSGPLQGK